jgi:sec-independent protein translocase protein TatC
MSDEPENLPAPVEVAEVYEDEGGGPIKSFLEHLEDLRWTLIRCSIAIALGIITCLSAGNFIIHLLTIPLERAQMAKTSSESKVIISIGTNILARLPAKEFPLTLNVTNRDVVYRLTPVEIGTNSVLALVADTNPPPSMLYNMPMMLKTYSPGGGFTIAVQLAIFGGLTISAPFVLLFLGQFILPAMHIHEKRFLYRVSGFASVLFFAGIAFCYFVMLPITLSTTAAFSNWLGFGADEWRADEFISFCCWFLLGMGISFQLPLVLLTLVKIGLLDVAGLSRYRSYFYVGILIIAGFVTPDGNPVTMLIMAAPLMVLYEMTVVIAWFWARQKPADSLT